MYLALDNCREARLEPSGQACSVGRSLTRYFLRPTAVILVAATIPLLSLSARPALAVADCQTVQNDGNQYTTRVAFHGMFSYMNTYDPVVPDIHSAFSLSHIYGYTNLASPSAAFIEVGWYKGLGGGLHRMDVSSPHYYRLYQDATGYHEFDDTQYPDAGSSRLYEYNYQGHDYTTGAEKWVYYYATLAKTQGPVHEIYGLTYVAPLVGGETTGGTTGVGMSSHPTPSVQLVNGGGTFNNWTSSYASGHAPTTACVSAPYTYTQLDYWQELRATGFD